MSELRLKAYYQYNGPSPASPLRSELPDDDVIWNLKMLPNDLTHALDERAEIEVPCEDYDRKEIELSIWANCTLEERLDMVKDALSKADLYGKIL